MNRLPTIPTTRYYTADQVEAMLSTVRWRMWIVWGWAMLLTVMVAASVRKQQFIPGLGWAWVPIIAVSVNALCFWFGMQIYFSRRKP